jgi:hypothetical protein
MNILHQFGSGKLVDSFKVSHLPSDHAVNGPCRRGQFGDQAGTNFRRRGWECPQYVKRQSEQGIAGQYGGGLIELDVASGLAPAKIVVIQRRQVIMDQ